MSRMSRAGWSCRMSRGRGGALYTILLAFIDYRGKDVDVTTVMLSWPVEDARSAWPSQLVASVSKVLAGL
jgi:hypothetical protein